MLAGPKVTFRVHTLACPLVHAKTFISPSVSPCSFLLSLRRSKKYIVVVHFNCFSLIVSSFRCLACSGFLFKAIAPAFFPQATSKQNLKWWWLFYSCTDLSTGWLGHIRMDLLLMFASDRLFIHTTQNNELMHNSATNVYLSKLRPCVFGISS